MYIDELRFAPEDLAWMDLPIEELLIEDLPSMEEVLRTTSTVISPPPTAGQTTFSERITIRINHSVLAELKKQAAVQGLRYQTYLNSILAQHAATTPSHDRKSGGGES